MCVYPRLNTGHGWTRMHTDKRLAEVSSEQVPVCVAAMDFLVAYRAVLITRRAHIVEGGRHHTGASILRYTRKVRVTLETNQPHLMVGEQARIGRAMRLMAGCASFKSHRGMLERERPA